MDGPSLYPLVVLHDPEPLVPTSPPTDDCLSHYDDSHAENATPFTFWCLLCWLLLIAREIIESLQLQVVEVRRQAHYWQAQHQRAAQREADLKEQLQTVQAELREWKRRLVGRKSETAAAAKPQAKTPPNPNPNVKRPRGQQRGSKGHGRRCHDQLPTTHETCELPPDHRCCSDCGQPFHEIPGTADGDILEIDIRAHRRRYHRQRYRRTCTCPGQPAVVTAPPPDKLFPKSHLGLSLWILLLRRKFEFFQPLYRILAELRGHDLTLSAGTITDGLQKLVPLFQPLYESLVEHNRGEGHWHCDETRWLVFVKRAGKPNFAWNLWVFAARESIAFVLDPTRAHGVPEDHFGVNGTGIINVDRYSAYKAMSQVKNGQILLAFCWAHVRRDFLTVLTSWPDLIDWAWSWVEDIGELYQRNDKRLSLDAGTLEYVESDRLVREQVESLRQRRDRELTQPDLRRPQRKVLTSLCHHWDGLTVFVEHPEAPMDNNVAERCHRGPVVGRKNFYGSGALWSGRLAAMLFSLFQTMQLWKLDVGLWLSEYLSACAKAKGQPPPDPERYLPWNMSADERRRLSLKRTERLQAEANPSP